MFFNFKIFDSSCNLRFRNDKNEVRQKLKCQEMLLEEKKKLSEISEISILPYTKNPKDANLGKGSFTQVLKCRTASYKLHTLRIIRKYISEEKAKVISTHLYIANLIMPYWCGRSADKKIFKD